MTIFGIPVEVMVAYVCIAWQQFQMNQIANQLGNVNVRLKKLGSSEEDGVSKGK